MCSCAVCWRCDRAHDGATRAGKRVCRAGNAICPNGRRSRPFRHVVRVAQWIRGVHTVIEHADRALAEWLSTIEPLGDVTFDAAVQVSEKRTDERTVASLQIRSIRERTKQRDNEVRDVRDHDGRVVERQRSTRFFDVDYLCSVTGEPLAAHRALGALIQLLVDHDRIPNEFVPTELADLGYPIDVHLGGGGSSGAAVVIQVVVPVRPTADREIAPPAEELQLDLMPPPQRRGTALAIPRNPSAAHAVAELEAKRWTRVRRREMIAEQGS